MEGTVKFFDEIKNFGFINGDDGKSYFVHASALKEGVNIREGDRVSFTAAQGDKGPKAEDVGKAEEKPAEEKKEEAPAEEAPAEEPNEEAPAEEPKAEEEKAAEGSEEKKEE